MELGARGNKRKGGRGGDLRSESWMERRDGSQSAIEGGRVEGKTDDVQIQKISLENKTTMLACRGFPKQREDCWRDN